MNPRSTSANSVSSGSRQKIPLYLCMGSACYHQGSPEILKIIQAKLEEHHLLTEVELMGHFCLGACTQAVLMRYRDLIFSQITPENVTIIFDTKILPLIHSD